MQDMMPEMAMPSMQTWGAAALLAVLVMWSIMMIAMRLPSAAPASAGILLILGGLYQYMPLKKTCLVHCRSPLSFLMTRWGAGVSGAFSMGVTHRIYCLGCCWFLMALLFVSGVMNLLWVAALALLVIGWVRY